MNLSFDVAISRHSSVNREHRCRLDVLRLFLLGSRPLRPIEDHSL